MTRPIERVPIAEQCARCGRRRLAGEVLCRGHLHLKFRQQEIAEHQRYPLVHQDVGRRERPDDGSRRAGSGDAASPADSSESLPTLDVGRADKAGQGEGAPAVHGGPTSQSAPVPTPVVGSLPASPESGSVVDSRQQPTTFPRNREERRQVDEAESFGFSVLVAILDKTCPHKEGDWCVWCSDEADRDEGEQP